MDPRVAGAGVAMAVAMLLLLPTFNALNQSYDSNVPPPDWFRPDKIPENLQPPDDIEDYPEGWEPPPNMTPPPGWEPPPGYDGPIPPGGCPPPQPVALESWTDSGSWTTNAQGTYTQTLRFDAPEYMVGFSGYINFTEWRAQTVAFEIESPNGTIIASDAQSGPGAGSILLPATPVERTTFSATSEDPRQTGELPPSGRYLLRIQVQTPIDGNWETEFAYALACGGMLS